MIVQLVKYKTGLTDEEAAKTIAQRAPQYKALPGLRQKLYIREPETGEYGGIYVWEDEDSIRDFRESDLAATIPAAYRVEASRESRCSRSSLSFAPNEVSHRRVEPVGGGGYSRSPAASRDIVTGLHSRSTRVPRSARRFRSRPWFPRSW